MHMINPMIQACDLQDKSYRLSHTYYVPGLGEVLCIHFVLLATQPPRKVSPCVCAAITIFTIFT